FPVGHAAPARPDRRRCLLSRLRSVRGHPGGQGLVLGAVVVAVAPVHRRGREAGSFSPDAGLLLAPDERSGPGQAAAAPASGARAWPQSRRMAVDQRARSVRTESPTDRPTVSLALAQRGPVQMLQANAWQGEAAKPNRKAGASRGRRLADRSAVVVGFGDPDAVAPRPG